MRIVSLTKAALATLSLLSPVFGGCAGGRGERVAFADTLYMPDYAKGFAIYENGESSVIRVRNPWQGADSVEIDLFLRRGTELPPEGFVGMVVDAPLRKVVCMSSSHIAFIDAVGAVDAVKGVSGAQYVTNDTIRARYGRSLVRDVGYDSNLNFEVLADIGPDLVMIYGIYGDNSAMTRKLDELGVKYMYIGDYVEQSPLGKAEWMVAFGEMFDKREAAKTLFDSVRTGYERTKSEIGKRVALLSSDKPKVMLNAPYRDTWFVPGDRSYMVQLIMDAGGEYACAGVDSEQSRPISGEAAFVTVSGSDLWLNPGQATSLAELAGENPRFAQTRPVVGGRVFNCNKRSTPGGGSDFWESGAVRPDIVLNDMVKMLYPWMMPDHELYYFRKLE